MLLLLLVVKGWMITHRRLKCETNLILFSLWTAYSTANVALFAWNQVCGTNSQITVCLVVIKIVNTIIDTHCNDDIKLIMGISYTLIGRMIDGVTVFL